MMTDAKAPEWIAWNSGKWIIGTNELDMISEFVYFRLVLHAYERGDPTLKGGEGRNSRRCKVSLDQYREAVSILEEYEKIIVKGDQIYIPSVAKRLGETAEIMTNRQMGAAKSRRKLELKKDGLTPSEIAKIIKEEFHAPIAQKTEQKQLFPDNQSDYQTTDIQTEQTNRADIEDIEDIQSRQRVDLDLAVSDWNAFASRNDLSQIRTLGSRESKLKARLKECGGVEGWRYVLQLCEQSPFLLGNKPGSDWKMGFDFLLQPSSFQKAIEGQYTPPEQKAQASDLMDAIKNLRGDSHGK